MIRQATIEDAEAIVKIYNHYVDYSIVTFDIYHASLESFQNKIQTSSFKFPWIVFEENGEILGYAHGNEWKAKDGYKHTSETTIYLKEDAHKKGLGTLLYTELIQQLKALNFHALIGCITLPNEPSIALHEKLGFEKSAHFKEVGYKFDQWIDVGYWELIVQ